MQYVIIAYDGKDAGALNRRMAARPAHIALSNKAIEAGEQIMAAALLNDAGEMHGSVMIVDFESREDLDAWLKAEPYMTGDVWKTIEVLPCKIGPSFSR